MAVESQKVEDFRLTKEPYYLPLGNEIELFESAYNARLPVMLKGPTGCGKTRFVEHMSWRLKRTLVTVACHEDLTASDLVGKYTLRGDETVWQDGPLTTAVKSGGIAYLDEVVEARKDTTVVIHPLTDDRRILPLEKKGEIVSAPEDFMLVISYNPGYQSVLKDLKHSTKQRFVAIEFDYPPPDLEESILVSESGIDAETAGKLVKIGEKVRNLRTHGLDEGVSTRLLVYAGQLIQGGVEPIAACEATICKPITDDLEMQRSIVEIIATQFFRPMTFGPAVGNVGMYVAREMLISVPEDQRQAYLRMVEEISDLKYQLGVEVARQLPRLLVEGDPERVARYLGQVREVAATGWKSGVEVAKQLPDLYDAPDPTLAGAYVEIVSEATAGPPEDTETAQLATELTDLERELREMEPKVKRAQELRTQLAARDRRDEKRRKHAVELASALPPILARLRPRYRPPYLDLVRQVAGADPEASLEAADTLLDLLNGERVSPEGAAEWVARGLEVLERNKEVGRGYFRLGSKYSLQVLEELKEGLALKSVARVLKLYATALSGQEIAIRGTNEMQAVDIFGIDHIILPPEMHFFEDDQSNFTAYKVATAHGAGRIEFGTYGFSLADIPETVERLRARYSEGPR